MTEQEIFDRLAAILSETFDIEAERIRPEARLYEDLDIVPIDAVDLIVKLKPLVGRRLQPEAFKQVRSLQDVVNGLCERLLAAGVPITRAHVSFAVLHPLYQAIGYTWWRGKGLTVEGYRHDASGDGSNRFLKSPYYHLLHHGLDHLRRRLDTGGEAEFPIIDDLRALDMTDYIAYASVQFQTAGVYVGVIAVGALGYLFDRALLLIRRLVIRGR